MTAGDPPVGVVHVVVPAHDEEQRVGACVGALADAVAAATARWPELVVTTTLVLDRCSDDTRDRALERARRTRLDLDLFPVDVGSVGAARRAGVVRAASRRPAPASTTWVASTDADSQVGPTWLVDHVELARDHDLVIGRVTPDPADLTPEVLHEWRRRHSSGSVHVHGANLGIRLSTYRAVGGFLPVDQHEDVLLVEAARSAGARWTQATVVSTSARTVGRTTGGFAAYLRHLEAEVG